MIQDQDLRERLKAPQKGQTIQRAIQYENRIRFHCESALDRWTASPYVRDYELWVSTQIFREKFPIFKSNISFPVITLEETSKIRKGLQKVNDAQNPVYKADFVSKNYEVDWQIARIEVEEDWKEQAESVYWNAPNSIVIVDLPEVQDGKFPEPYFYFVNICHAIDWDNNGKSLEWIAIKQGTNILVLDDYSYRIFAAPQGPATMMLTAEAPHGLGQCPANWLVQDSISEKEPDIKVHALTNYLTKLDHLHFYLTSQIIADQSVPWPITISFEEECNFKYESGDIYRECDHGFLRDGKGSAILLADGQQAPCPQCASRRFAGAGTVKDVPLPSSANNYQNMMDAVKIVGPETKGSEYYAGRIAEIKKELKEGTLGYGGEPTNDQAQNEKQVMSMFEGMKAVLTQYKKGWEYIETWRDTIICKLKYGANFLGVMIDKGTDWFLFDSTTLLTIYSQGLEKDWDISILDLLYDQYIVTKFRNNQQQLQRELIIKNLDPLLHVSMTRATSLYQSGKIDEITYLIKLNLYTFVIKFEREQAPLVEYGSNLTFGKKIEVIKSIIYEYGKGIKGQSIQTTGNGQPPISGNVQTGIPTQAAGAN